MLKQDITIVNKLGLHARAATKFVSCASGFESSVHIAREGQEVNGKSIMGVMMLAASQGTVITVTTDGNDEQETMDSLKDLIGNRFGEPQ
ncbi:MAG TPA: HPr family phosphocarrier protein [Chromatiaceae bacterium]|jgi:phosphocarrier protein|nr:HPr family phosphocarrier protein [Chromatiaceae bacterium]HIB83725.1 HPr family phosphocarrier protein [Chromatiaceae bacterium]HIN83028.1 HPr family phosphocarrier protein [Chromatiales bacterium]HIO14797.1 HPr family phosphocarrier protein [Chromatiales bacterium]HIO54348.1 HPr family phosphocarrier protein [Chromatiales bacterium]